LIISWPGVNGPISGRPFGSGFGAGVRGSGIAGGSFTGGAPGSGRGAGLRGVGRSRLVGFGFGFVRRAGRVRRFGCGFGLAPLAIHNCAGSSDGEPICGAPAGEGGGASHTSTGAGCSRGGVRGGETGSVVRGGFNSGRGGGNGAGGRDGSRSRGIHGSKMNGRPKSGTAHRRLRMLAM
jgi:hypothetical protein